MEVVRLGNGDKKSGKRIGIYVFVSESPTQIESL